MCLNVVIAVGASDCGKLQVVDLPLPITLEFNSMVIGPGHVVTQFSTAYSLGCHLFVDLWIFVLNYLVQVRIHFLELSTDLIIVELAVLLVH